MLPCLDQLWQEIIIDFITGLPPSRWGDKVYNIIYIIVDRYTKMALYLPMVKTITVTELADLFFNKVVRHFRTPRGIISDYSSIFTSKFWLELCFTVKIKHKLSTAFYLQIDG
jgi:hypothetical protein